MQRCNVLQVVQDTVTDAVQEAVAAAFEENGRFDVRANFYTLIAITGVVLYWRGIWNSWSALLLLFCSICHASCFDGAAHMQRSHQVHPMVHCCMLIHCRILTSSRSAHEWRARIKYLAMLQWIQAQLNLTPFEQNAVSMICMLHQHSDAVHGTVVRALICHAGTTVLGFPYGVRWHL